MDQEKIQQVRDKQAQDAKTQADEFKTQKQASRLISTVKDSNSKVIRSFNTGSLAVAKTTQQTNKTLERVNTELNASLKEVARQIGQMAKSLKTLAPIPNDDTEVIKAIKELDSTMAKLPSQIEIPEVEKVEEVKVSNQVDYSKQFESILKALKAIDINPSFNVDAPKIDLSGITKAIESIKLTTKDIPAPQVNVDMQEVVDGLKQVVNTVAGLKFPIPNYVLPFKDANGAAAQSPIPLIDRAYDYVGMTSADGNGNYQIFTYKVGGASGTTVRTLTYTYDGSSNVTSITRT